MSLGTTKMFHYPLQCNAMMKDEMYIEEQKVKVGQCFKL